MSAATHNRVEYNPLPAEPVTNEQGITIYPTSFIPARGHMEPSRIPTAKMSGLSIEVIHVGVFFLLIWVLFYQMWKKPNER